MKKLILVLFLLVSYNSYSQSLKKNYDNNNNAYYYSHEVLDFSESNYSKGFVVSFGYLTNINKVLIPVVYFGLNPCIVKGLMIIRFETGESIYLVQETTKCDNTLVFIVKRTEHEEMLTTRSVKSIEFSHVSQDVHFFENVYGRDRLFFINMIKELNKEL